MQMQLTAVYQKCGRWYVAYVEEIPGANTQGRTLQEAKENLKEALKLVIEANRELSTNSQDGSLIKEPILMEL